MIGVLSSDDARLERSRGASPVSSGTTRRGLIVEHSILRIISLSRKSQRERHERSLTSYVVVICGDPLRKRERERDVAAPMRRSQRAGGGVARIATLEKRAVCFLVDDEETKVSHRRRAARSQIFACAASAAR